MDPATFVATGFGLGLMPFAPGTWGSLLALGWRVLEGPLGFAPRAILAAVAVIAGVPLCGHAARRFGRHDPPEVVWDEVAALLAATLAVPFRPLPLLVLFLSFRFFDILKPWPVRVLDRRVGGGIGIMADDLAAAFLATIVSVLFLRLLRA
jgi:phosphatidylglycerophosphatase A